MADTQILFLHHLDRNNKHVVNSNFNSFVKCGNDILGIRDEDTQGLHGSCPVTTKGKIPRGPSRWKSTDTVFINYILESKDMLKHKFYMLCEYDCYCECNVDTYCDPYMKFDVCAPHVVTQKKEKDWGWFKGINLSCDLVGLRPSVFLLFSKDAIVAIAEKYVEIWGDIQNSNCEARLGSVASLLGMSIVQFKELSFNVSWGKTKFKRNNKLYHPVKSQFDQSQIIPEPDSNDFSGVWDFGRKNSEKIATLILQTDGTIANYDQYNETYWSSSEGEVVFYSGRGAITSRFHDANSDGRKCRGDYYDGEIDGEKVSIADYHWIRKVI